MNNDIQNRIKSIRQTVQISSAQKLIAASNINKARQMLESTRPYHDRIRSAITETLASVPENSSRYFTNAQPANLRRGVIVLAANKGLTGGYNSSAIQFAERSLEGLSAHHLIVLGKKGRDTMANAGYGVDMRYNQDIEPPAMFSARELADQITEIFQQGKVDCYDVIYTHFTSTVRLKPVERRLFPLSPSLFTPPEKLNSQPDGILFEPEPEAVLDSLMLKYLKGFLYGCMVHSWISELASRMTAMDSAVRNGNDMLDELSLAYNRRRQAGITQEITEIVAGAAAMSSDD